MLGLVHPDEYRNELKGRLNINDETVNNIIKDINEQMLSGIREKLKEIYENTEESSREEDKRSEEKNDAQVLNTAGIEIVPEKLELGTAEQSTESREEVLKKVEKPEPTTVPPILAQKLSGSFQIPSVKTEHFLPNLSSVKT